MSDIMDDLRRVEANMSLGRPRTPEEKRHQQLERLKAHLYLVERAPDLREMILGVPETADLKAVVLGGEDL